MDLQLKVQKPLKELVYLELKHKILTGEIQSETRLMEISLAETMNVSRTPIREAISRLADEGLVQVEPRRGAYVSKISIKNMLDIFETREDLEGFTAYLATKRSTDKQKLELRRIAERYAEATERQDKELVIELDEAFHNYIVGCCNNDTLAEMIKYIQDLSLRFRYLYYDDFSLYPGTAEQHAKIMEAISAGDADLARKEGEEHIRILKNFIFELGKKLEQDR